MVHYVSFGTPVRADGSQAFTSQCRSATITEVSESGPPRVGLCVMNPTGLFFHSLADGGSAQDEGSEIDGARKGGTWHFPESKDA
jgi:hypothetical protein